MRRYCELVLLERAGEISELRRQVPIKLEGRDGPIKYPSGRQAKVVVDFQYIEGDELVSEDFKGTQTHLSKLQHAVLAAQGIHVRISR